MPDCSVRLSASVTEVTPLCGPAALTFVCTVRALAIQAKNTSRIPGRPGSKLRSPSSRLARDTMLYSSGGRDGTPRMVARAAGFTSGNTRRNTDTTCNGHGCIKDDHVLWNVFFLCLKIYIIYIPTCYHIMLKLKHPTTNHFINATTTSTVESIYGYVHIFLCIFKHF